MDVVFPGGFTLPAAVWLPLAAGVVGLVVGILTGRARVLRARMDLREVAARVARERDRADTAERELRAERANLEPLEERHRHLLLSLTRATQDLARSDDRRAIAQALGRALERTLCPRQWMVFLAADAEGREFLLEAAAASEGEAWPVGSRLPAATGKLGLVTRRRTAMDRRDFDAEPPLVRDQVRDSEPTGFRIDAAAPVVVGENVVALLAVGGTELPLDTARATLELLALSAAQVFRNVELGVLASQLANYDELTALPNKACFSAHGAEVLYHERLAGRDAALVLFGIDDFRAYVDQNGHPAADRLLRGIADAIRPSVREGDFFARWAGAEFVVLMPGADVRLAHAFASHVRSLVGSIDWPFGRQQPRGRLTLCAGISSTPANGATLDQLVDAAAQNLAAAKWSGGDTTGSVVVAAVEHANTRDDDDHSVADAEEFEQRRA